MLTRPDAALTVLAVAVGLLVWARRLRAALRSVWVSGFGLGFAGGGGSGRRGPTPSSSRLASTSNDVSPALSRGMGNRSPPGAAVVRCLSDRTCESPRSARAVGGWIERPVLRAIGRWLPVVTIVAI